MKHFHCPRHGSYAGFYEICPVCQMHVQEIPQQTGIDATLNTRGSTHGEWVEQATTAENIKVSMHHASNWERLAPHQREALDIIAVKIARVLCGNFDEPDHWHDIAGYATLVEKELLK